MKRRLALLLLLTASNVFADSDGTLSLSPAVVALQGQPGAGTTQRLRMHNGTTQTITFDLEAEDVVVRDGARQRVRAGVLPSSIAATAVFSQPDVTIGPGETANVSITLTFPANAPGRGVVAFFKARTKVKSGATSVLASLGSLLTFSMSGETALAANPIKVTPQTGATNLAFDQVCSNSGAEPLMARGIAVVLDSNRKVVGKIDVEPKRLLPGERHSFHGEYGGELAQGTYQLVTTYEFEGHTITQTAEVSIQ